MAWTWRYERSDGTTVDGPPPERFTSQSDAETWLGQTWRELAAQGVEQVSLLDDGALRYTMPLTPAD